MSCRKKPVTKAMRLERRKYAEERNEAYSKLSLEEKLARLPVDGAKRQREKLMAKLAEKSAAPTNSETAESKPKKGKK